MPLTPSGKLNNRIPYCKLPLKGFAIRVMIEWRFKFRFMRELIANETGGHP
jgi:hypothetical protein